MTLTAPFPHPDTPIPTGRIVTASVFVHAIRLEVEIGIHDHEYGRTQPLLIDVEIELAVDTLDLEHIAGTVNYETILGHARDLSAEGHFKLVETYARRLAMACLEEPLARRVRVRVEKPQALAPHAEGAGVELVVER